MTRTKITLKLALILSLIIISTYCRAKAFVELDTEQTFTVESPEFSPFSETANYQAKNLNLMGGTFSFDVTNITGGPITVAPAGDSQEFGTPQTVNSTGSFKIDFSNVPPSIQTLGLSFVPLEGLTTITFKVRTEEILTSSSSSSGETSTFSGFPSSSSSGGRLVDFDKESFSSLNSLVMSLENLFNAQLDFAKRGDKVVAKSIERSIISILNTFDSDVVTCKEVTSTEVNNLSNTIDGIKMMEVDKEFIPIFEGAVSSIGNVLMVDNNSDGIPDFCNALETSNSTALLQKEENIENISMPIPGQFIIEFAGSENAPSSIAEELAQKYDLMVLNIYSTVIKGANVIADPDIEETLSNDPLVKEVIQDFTVSAVESILYDGQPSKLVLNQSQSSVQDIPTGIRWIEANRNRNEGDGTTVAVLDTGINFDHPDLMQNINTTLSVDLTGEGTAGRDNYFHGTAVSGVIAAEDNGEGVLGVGSMVKLVSVKVLGMNGKGAVGSIVAGLDYITRNAPMIDVANLSLAGFCSKEPLRPDFPRRLNLKQFRKYFKELTRYLLLHSGWLNCKRGALDIEHRAITAATRAGIVIVVAAGNDSRDITEYNYFPAMFPEVITVSAVSDMNGIFGNLNLPIRSDDRWADFSNFGSEVDVIAPGFKILTTDIGGGYSFLDGTSLAAPHVTGAVALYISRNGRTSSLNQIISAITRPRPRLPLEPNDGFVEPACWANSFKLR